MSGSELPQGLEELIAGYVLGNLSSEEAEEFRQLLAAHPELSTEITLLQEVLGLMPYALPQVAPPQHIRVAVLEAVDDVVGENYSPLRRRWPWKRITASIAAILVLALSLDNYFLRRQLRIMQVQTLPQKDVISMLKNANTHLISLKGMDMASAASGSIVITPGEQEAVLVVQNLPVLPEGQFYQLWAVVNGEKISWGQFNTSSQGTVLIKLSIPPVTDAAQLVFTVEVSPAPWQPDGGMVMTSQL